MASVATTDLSSWVSQDQHVERLLENAALTAINPDDTLVFAGPPRWSQVDMGNNNILVLGLLQQLSFSQGANVQPFRAIGSARNLFLRDSPPGQFTASRLWVNGRNLLRAAMTSARQAGLDVKALQSPPVPDDKDSTFPVWLDLNSEVFFVGFGLGMIFGDKTHSQVASVYLEDCRINGFTTGITSGASAVMENIS